MVCMPLTPTWVPFYNSSWMAPGLPWLFFSKKSSVAEHKYSDFNRELLATYSSLRHF